MCGQLAEICFHVDQTCEHVISILPTHFNSVCPGKANMKVEITNPEGNPIETSKTDEAVETKTDEKRKKVKTDTTTKKAKYFLVSLVFVFCACFVFFGYNTFLDQNEPFKMFNQTLNPNFNESEEEGCDYIAIVGDDICDDVANTEVCAYDFGDCCSLDNDRISSCQECYCFIDTTIQSTFLQGICQFMTWKNLLILHELGDGDCHLAYNQEKYDFDLGDCCIPDAQCYTPPISGYAHELSDCPENVCIQSNTFCVPNQVSDGICQDYNNHGMCYYDGGDCCLTNTDQSQCCECHCKGDYLQ